MEFLKLAMASSLLNFYFLGWTTCSPYLLLLSDTGTILSGSFSSISFFSPYIEPPLPFLWDTAVSFFPFWEVSFWRPPPPLCQIFFASNPETYSSCGGWPSVRFLWIKRMFLISSWRSGAWRAGSVQCEWWPFGFLFSCVLFGERFHHASSPRSQPALPCPSNNYNKQ